MFSKWGAVVDEKNKWKKYGLWRLRSRLRYLQSERPLIFNFYHPGSSTWSYSAHQITLDELKDPDIIIALGNVDYEIAETVISIKRLEEELKEDKEEPVNEDLKG
jgi:hypothetical protein